MRRKRGEAHENHERWLVSYADFITLLFAFFVVMFATSKADKAKAAQVSESVKKALEKSEVARVAAVLLGGTVDNSGKGNAQLRGPGGHVKAEADKTPQPVELLPPLNVLSKELEQEIKSGKIEVHLEN